MEEVRVGVIEVVCQECGRETTVPRGARSECDCGGTFRRADVSTLIPRATPVDSGTNSSASPVELNRETAIQALMDANAFLDGADAIRAQGMFGDVLHVDCPRCGRPYLQFRVHNGEGEFLCPGCRQMKFVVRNGIYAGAVPVAHEPSAPERRDMLDYQTREKRGKFFINDEIMSNSVEDVIEIFRGMIPFRVEHLGYMPGYEVIAYHPSFDKVERGEIVPEYEVKIERREGGPAKVSFERVCVKKGPPNRPESGTIQLNPNSPIRFTEPGRIVVGSDDPPTADALYQSLRNLNISGSARRATPREGTIHEW